MQRRKSQRHVKAAKARWRNAEARAQVEREAGIPDRAPDVDLRAVLTLDLTSYGGPLLRIEPRPGRISVRVVEEDSGEVVDCCALKTALIRIAGRLPRTIGARHRHT